MPSIGRMIKNILYSKTTPDFLFSYYFKWKNEKDKKQLYALLESGIDLLEKVEPGIRDHWLGRIETVLKSPDNIFIPRHEKAGKIVGKHLIMHNGIKVDPLSYYNLPTLKMFLENKGVHEPQEEKVFQEVMKAIEPKKAPVMLELGAYWSFYSMWFMQQFPNAQCVMVEPDRKNLFYGMENLKLNDMKGKFIHSGIGKAVDRGTNISTVDQICAEQKIKFIDILHSDIQGFEFDMLKGAVQTLSANKVGYVFVSTHSNELHEDCRKLLAEKYKFEVVASANLDESFSWDGILVMKSPGYQGIEKVAISKRILQNVSGGKADIN